MALVPVPDPGPVHASDPTTEARRLRILVDGLPALIGYWDRHLHNVVANEAYLEWFGTSPQDMPGLHVREVLGESVFAQNEPYMLKALAGEEQLFQRTLLDPQGRIRHIQTTYSPDLVDGEVVGLFVMATDVTPHVEAQRQLDEAQELAEIGSWTLIPATKQIAWSTQMYRILGHDPATYFPTTESLISQVHPDDRDRAVAAVRAAGVSGVGYELSYRIVRPDGEVREVHSRVRAERVDGGLVTRLTGVMQDITSSNLVAAEMGRVNDELRKVNQLNADVLGVVGHDVRAPLALVLGHLEELSATWDESTEEGKKARVDKAFTAARRLAALCDDILAMANFDSGTIATRPIRVDLREVVEDALAGLHARSHVEVRAEGSPVSVIDPFHLRQMIANLLSNALRYGAPPVVVTVTETDGSAIVEVTDHGAGVPEDFVPHLFDRFTRASTGVATEHRGSGFGLYIVSRLADANGCRLTYSPGSPSGSTFRLRLPLPSA